MKEEGVVYQISVLDIQQVANIETNNDLSEDEIKKVIEYIEKNIDWFGVISEGISQIR